MHFQWIKLNGRCAVTHVGETVDLVRGSTVVVFCLVNIIGERCELVFQLFSVSTKMALCLGCLRAEPKQ